MILITASHTVMILITASHTVMTLIIHASLTVMHLLIILASPTVMRLLIILASPTVMSLLIIHAILTVMSLLIILASPTAIIHASQSTISHNQPIKLSSSYISLIIFLANAIKEYHHTIMRHFISFCEITLM